MARLFVSYKREEQAYAFAVRQWLIDHQDWPPNDIFVDRDKLHAGDSWANKIFSEAEACEAMLFLASDASLKPDSFCYKELQRARGVTLAVTIRGLSPEDERLRSALPHGADARQITALDGQPTDAFSFVSPVDGTHGAIALNRLQVESIGQTLRDLGIAPNSFTWKAIPEGPYRGLGALQEGDEALFFGREREIRDCIRMLEQIRHSVSDRALVIVAPSGAGKSSLLRAGLWRRLRRHAAFSPLAIVRTRQGVLSHEDWGLAAGLAKPEANILRLPLGSIEERIALDLPRLLADFAEADASTGGGRRTLLLGIDQAEEMAALSAPNEAEELRRLFEGIAEAGRTLDLRLVLTARDDSVEATLERLTTFGIRQEAVRTYSLHRMPPPRFKDVIERPARVADQSGFPLKLDEALTTALADAAAQNQGEFSDALPVLALALQRLVKKRRSPNGTIELDPESASRLVSDAVADAAREAVEAVKADEDAFRRLIIPRLATWDPRAGEGGAAKRRMACSSELFSGDRASLKALAGALVDQRLLTRAGDNYEVSHEALLRVAPLGALILALREKFLRVDMLTMEARDWWEHGRRGERIGRTGERLSEAQALLDDEDFGAMLSVPALRVREYLAACVVKDREDREWRERSERYQVAQNIAAPPQPQAQLQKVDVSADPRGNGLHVYISFSRADTVVADKIRAALERNGFATSIDFTDISAGEDWKNRIASLIRDADSLVFLLSADSANSTICAWEVEEAVRLGKRIIPVLIGDLGSSSPPGRLARLNYVVLRDEAKYELGMEALVSVLSTDFDWLREHTRYLQRAMEWDAAGQPPNRLLSGPDAAAAEAWLVHRPESAPEATELQLNFIKASKDEEIRRQSTEAHRLREVDEAQAARAAAQEREAEKAMRFARRSRVGAAVAIVLALAAGSFALVAAKQRDFALAQTEQANKQTREASEQRMIAAREKDRAEQFAIDAKAQQAAAEAATARVKILEAALRQIDEHNPALKEP
jgi:TIR domain